MAEQLLILISSCKCNRIIHYMIQDKHGVVEICEVSREPDDHFNQMTQNLPVPTKS